jgi:hypothetical protein
MTSPACARRATPHPSPQQSPRACHLPGHSRPGASPQHHWQRQSDARLRRLDSLQLQQTGPRIRGGSTSGAELRPLAYIRSKVPAPEGYAPYRNDANRPKSRTRPEGLSPLGSPRLAMPDSLSVRADSSTSFMTHERT